MRKKRKYITLSTIEGRHSFYKTKEWRDIRVLVLRSSPFCVKCTSNYSIDVDHIIDLKDAPERALDITNLQALCKSCHAEKTNIGNKYTKMEPVNLKWKINEMGL